MTSIVSPPQNDGDNDKNEKEDLKVNNNNSVSLNSSSNDSSGNIEPEVLEGQTAEIGGVKIETFKKLKPTGQELVHTFDDAKKREEEPEEEPVYYWDDDLDGNPDELDEDEFFDAPSSLSEQTGVDVEWEVRYDPVHQHPYWINIITGESSWENPNGENNSNDYTGEVEGYEYTEGVPQEQVAYGVTSSSNDMYNNNTGTNDDSNNNSNVINDNNNSVADDTWERHYDPESDWYYYYNPITGETKWDNITEEYMGDGDYQSTIDEHYYENNHITDNLENNQGENSFNEQGEVVEEATSSSSSNITTTSNNSTVQAGVARAWLKEARKLQAIGAK